MPAFQRRKLRGWGWRGTSHERSYVRGETFRKSIRCFARQRTPLWLTGKKKKRKPKAPPGPMQGDLHWKGQPAGRAPAVAGRQQHPGGLQALGGARWVTSAGLEPGQRGAGRSGQAAAGARLERGVWQGGSRSAWQDLPIWDPSVFPWNRTGGSRR